MKIRYTKLISLVMALAILSSALSLVGCDDDTKGNTPPADAPVLMWRADGLFAFLPPPTTQYGTIVTDTKELVAFETYYVEKTDFSLYIQLCMEKGYTYSVVNSEFFYSATNTAGYKLSAQFNDSTKTIKVSLDATNIKLTVPMNSDFFKGLQKDDVIEMLSAIGFSNITVKITEIPDESEILNGTVESVRINSLPFEEDAEFQKADPVVVRYYMRNITFSASSAELMGKNYAEVEALLRGAGFVNVTCKEVIVSANYELAEGDNGTVFAISVNGKNDFLYGERVSPNAMIIINYYSFKVVMNTSAESLRFQDPESVAAEMGLRGFKNVTLQVTRDITGVDIGRCDGTVASVSIGGNSAFTEGTVFERNAPVVITYYQYYITIEASVAEMKSYMTYQEAEEYLKALGFTNVSSVKSQPLFNGWLHSDGEIYSITVNGKASNFSAGAEYTYDTKIVIGYYYFQ